MKNEEDVGDFLLADVGFYLARSKSKSYRESITLALSTFLIFLQDSNLTVSKLIEEDGELDPGIKIWKSDLTEEGFEFYSQAHDKFFDAIDRGLEPTDPTVLERELTKLRQK